MRSHSATSTKTVSPRRHREFPRVDFRHPLCLLAFYQMRGAYTMENENFDLDYEIEKAMEKAESIEEYKKIIRVALGKWLKNLQSGQIKLDKVSDLKILIEADFMLKDLDGN